MKKMLIFLLIFILAMTMTTYAAETPVATFHMNQANYEAGTITGQLNLAPYKNAEGVIMMPLRDSVSVISHSEATLTWDAKTNTATVKKGKRITRFTVGKKEIVQDGKLFKMEAAAEIYGGTLCVPIKGITEALWLDFGHGSKTEGYKSVVDTSVIYIYNRI